MTIAGTARAQQMDLAFGMGTLSAPSATVNSQGFLLPSLGGGAYPVFSGDLLFDKGQIGVNREVAWSGSRAFYAGDRTQPDRPLVYGFNAIWSRNFGRLGAEATAGSGAER